MGGGRHPRGKSRLWRRSWLALAAVLCLVVAPVFGTFNIVSALAAEGYAAAAPEAVHVHADGKLHQHAAAHDLDDNARAAGGKAHPPCGDGCCLGKGCPLCGLAIGAGAPAMAWALPRAPVTPFMSASTAGIVPPPPSPPPRA